MQACLAVVRANARAVTTGPRQCLHGQCSAETPSSQRGLSLQGTVLVRTTLHILLRAYQFLASSPKSLALILGPSPKPGKGLFPFQSSPVI